MPPEDDKLLEAVSTAVEQATPPDVQQAAPADPPDDAPPASDPPADDAQAPAEGEAPATTEAQADPPAADRPRDASGRFLPKDQQQPSSADANASAKAPAKAPAPAAPKQADNVNDPIPADVKGRTRERMEGLIGEAKQYRTERDTAQSALKEWNDAVKATGADPETFGRHMELLGAMLSRDPNQQREAAKLLRAAADQIATSLGDTPAGKDPLEGHKDLQERLDDGDITRELAIELATSRNQRKAAETHRARDEQVNAVTAAQDAAVKELNEYGYELQRTDPLFSVKAAILKPAVQALVKSGAHPSTWLATYRDMYAKLPKNLAGNTPAGNRAPAGTGAQQPLRPKQGAGAGPAPAPTSVDQAIDFGLMQERASRGR